METRKQIFLSLLFILMGKTSPADQQGPSIKVPPLKTSALLYGLANFTCEGIGKALHWTVRSKVLDDLIKQDRNISVTTYNTSDNVSSILTIRALPKNDGIYVGCIVIGKNYIAISKSATFTISGISPVKNILLTFTVTGIPLLTWSPPFENILITYDILIENQYGQLLYRNITKDTSYEFLSLTSCDVYTATVIAYSGKYSSRNASVQNEIDEENYIIISPDYTVTFCDNSNVFEVMFPITIVGYPRLCNSTLLVSTKEESLQNGTETEHISINTKQHKESVTVYYTLTNIKPQLTLLFIARILDHFNTTKAQNVSHFKTYHVQSLTIMLHSDNGLVDAECKFANRSTANGCNVVFKEVLSGTEISINITKYSTENDIALYKNIRLPVSGTYNVTAHDVVDGNIITNPSVVYYQVLMYRVQPSLKDPITAKSNHRILIGIGVGMGAIIIIISQTVLIFLILRFRKSKKRDGKLKLLFNEESRFNASLDETDDSNTKFKFKSSEPQRRNEPFTSYFSSKQRYFPLTSHGTRSCTYISSTKDLTESSNNKKNTLHSSDMASSSTLFYRPRPLPKMRKCSSWERTTAHTHPTTCTHNPLSS